MSLWNSKVPVALTIKEYEGENLRETIINLAAEEVFYNQYLDGPKFNIVLVDEIDYTPRHRKEGVLYG